MLDLSDGRHTTGGSGEKNPGGGGGHNRSEDPAKGVSHVEEGYVEYLVKKKAEEAIEGIIQGYLARFSNYKKWTWVAASLVIIFVGFFGIKVNLDIGNLDDLSSEYGQKIAALEKLQAQMEKEYNSRKVLLGEQADLVNDQSSFYDGAITSLTDKKSEIVSGLRSMQTQFDRADSKLNTVLDNVDSAKNSLKEIGSYSVQARDLFTKMSLSKDSVLDAALKMLSARIDADLKTMQQLKENVVSKGFVPLEEIRLTRDTSSKSSALFSLLKFKLKDLDGRLTSNLKIVVGKSDKSHSENSVGSLHQIKDTNFWIKMNQVSPECCDVRFEIGLMGADSRSAPGTALSPQ